jgi:predicted ribosome quality control (RQC) complex YloA/Tae2 family protein
MQAPQFCMVLRKHLMGGRVLGVFQPEFERIVRIDIENRTEMGDTARKTLFIEIMGRHSNIILTDVNGRVLDAVKHIPPSVSAVRTILPGAQYSPPPGRGKTNPLADGALPDPSSTLFAQFNGISPQLGEEVCAVALKKGGIQAAFDDFVSRVKAGEFAPHMYFNEAGRAADITAWGFETLAHLQSRTYDSPSLMLENFYARRDVEMRLQQRTADLRRHINTLLERCRNKAAVHDRSMAETHERDSLRIFGELITANMHAVPKGATSFTAQNYYAENEPIDIPLDPRLSPGENAQKYFNRYNKQKRAAVAVSEQITQNNADAAYLETVLAALDNAQTDADINEIRTELAAQPLHGGKPLRGGNKKQPHGGKLSHGSKKKQPRTPESKPLHFTSSDGYDIFVGKNNTQNDRLTLRTAHATDIWLHTKDIPGSHVILLTRGAEVPERTLLEAANLAAWHSRARTSSNVPVDYVARKHVRKPAGAKPGFVIYDFHKTVYVTPVEPG